MLCANDFIVARQHDPKRTGIQQIQRALHIAKTLGYYVAARFLYNRGWSLEAARWILLKK